MKLQFSRQPKLDFALVLAVEANLLLNISVFVNLLLLESIHLIDLKEWLITPIVNLTRYRHLLKNYLPEIFYLWRNDYTLEKSFIVVQKTYLTRLTNSLSIGEAQ